MAPAELEALLNGWERIADAAGIGIADDRAGEPPKAFVVKQAGHEGLTEQEVCSASACIGACVCIWHAHAWPMRP